MTLCVPEISTMPADGFCMLMHPTSWANYKRAVRQLRDERRRYRITFADNRLELIAPGPRHESLKTLIARMVELYSLVADIRLRGMGSTLYESVEALKALEPDECYYINRPPGEGLPITDDNAGIPDLAIEIDVSSSSVPREPIYATLGVPEIWRWKNNDMTVLRLQDGRYEVVETSVVLPDFPMAAMVERVRSSQVDREQEEIVPEWFAWLQSQRR